MSGGDKDWLDSNLRGRSVTGYLPIEFGGPPKLCEPVAVHVGYFDVSFTTVMDGAKPKQGYTVETVDRQQFTVDGSTLVEVNPPSGSGSSASSCTGRLVIMSSAAQGGPGRGRLRSGRLKGRGRSAAWHEPVPRHLGHLSPRPCSVRERARWARRPAVSTSRCARSPGGGG